MKRVFSVEDISDHHWSPPPQPTKLRDESESEWDFQRFLQDIGSDSSSSTAKNVVGIRYHGSRKTTSSSIGDGGCGGGASNIPVDSAEYQAFPKSRIDSACAAISLFRASFLKPEDSPAGVDYGSQTSVAPNLPTHVRSEVVGYDLSRSQDSDAYKLLGISSLRAIPNVSDLPDKPTTSGSSRDLSKDDENESETQMTENMHHVDAKRARRMLSNRESARLLKRRKQARLTKLEKQVSQLLVENSLLLKRLKGINQRYNEAAVDNRVLKADVDTLMVKVQMAEETVKRITGLSPMFHSMPSVSITSMPSFEGSHSETLTDVAIPVQDNLNIILYQPPNNNAGQTGNNMGRTASLRSLELLQQRSCWGISSCAAQSKGEKK
ncbi:hypothetical protein K2173_006964 [Erythroxylum novogranatense]|uniref:BZIP domain-containing protein n=1 Tax=Erythroxylum novogranatense TaxID=1862640 RepID=A0AAV8SYP3_9ROSI|nr:hypothetical protein K2173_006964 [Erythroxylum novogranatense]